MTDTTLIAWIKDLNEDYLADWANRGLLRRGRKLAQALDASSCTSVDTGYQAEDRRPATNTAVLLVLNT